MDLTFGEVLEDLRKEAGLTQEDLANQTGISINSIRSYEKNQNMDVSLTNLLKFARFFNVSLDYLAGKKAEKTIQDTPVEELGLSDQALTSLKETKYNHRILSAILAHPDFQRLMLDAEVLMDQTVAMKIRQSNALLEVARMHFLEQSGGELREEIQMSEIGQIDENAYVLAAIHNDIDHILLDILSDFRPVVSEEEKQLAAIAARNEMINAFSNAQNHPISSPEQLLAILLGALQVPMEKLKPDQLSAITDVVKQSDLLKSNVSQRGKKKS